jgi:nitroreductase
MDVFDALKNRRMHRNFTDEPVDEESLARLVWATKRAPSGGNTIIRRVVVVDDPLLIKTLRLVTPSLFCLPTAIMLICTDVALAEATTGKQGRHILSLVDAGAAAANVALAAVELGLGVCFVRSSNEAALREVLGMPDTIRPDIMIAIGHPAPAPSPVASRRIHPIYRNAWGESF